MSVKPDIVELFGLPPTDPGVGSRLLGRQCPFVNTRCTHLVRGSGNPTGVCSVTMGATKTPVMVCENRLYGDNYATLRMVATEAFGVADFIIGGSREDLEEKLVDARAPAVVAVGEGSGEPVRVVGRAKIAFDWILQHYTQRRRKLGFVGVEVHMVELGGNFRACRDAYKELQAGRNVPVPPSEHTLAWPDLQKKFLPEMIQKGLVLSQAADCQGYFVILPEIVAQRLADILDDLPEQNTIGSDIVSFRTYAPDAKTASGVRGVRAMNYRLHDVVAAHYGRPDEKASQRLSKILKELLQ